MPPKELFNKIYQEGQSVWTFKEPPKELVELVDSRKILPCEALDVGCGEGYHSIYLAYRGFRETGIDFSDTAIQLAKSHAQEAGVTCDFLAMECKDLGRLGRIFGFVLDWRFLHELLAEDERKCYVEAVSQLLPKGGKYLSVSFNDQTGYGGTGKVRTTPIGTTLYYASMEDLDNLFGSYFKILEKKIIELPLKKGPNTPSGTPANYFFMEKKC